MSKKNVNVLKELDFKDADYADIVNYVLTKRDDTKNKHTPTYIVYTNTNHVLVTTPENEVSLINDYFGLRNGCLTEEVYNYLVDTGIHVDEAVDCNIYDRQEIFDNSVSVETGIRVS